MLGAALTYALDCNHVSCAPVWKQVKQFRGVNVPRCEYLEIETCRRVVAACDEDFGIFVKSWLHANGARPSEVARLKVGDVNIGAGTLHIRHSKAFRNRHIALTADGLKFFRDLVDQRAPGEILVGRTWDRAQWRQGWIRACERADVPYLVPYSLRHTWASHAAMGNMPLPVIAKNLGHVDTTMVERHYGHLAPSYVADSTRKHAPRFKL